MFYDYHTHSFFSDDSETPLTLMLDAGVKNGLIQMAVTDHFDPGYPDPDYPFELNFPLYHEELEKKAGTVPESAKSRQRHRNRYSARSARPLPRSSAGI